MGADVVEGNSVWAASASEVTYLALVVASVVAAVLLLRGEPPLRRVAGLVIAVALPVVGVALLALLPPARRPVAPAPDDDALPVGRP